MTIWITITLVKGEIEGDPVEGEAEEMEDIEVAVEEDNKFVTHSLRKDFANLEIIVNFHTIKMDPNNNSSKEEVHLTMGPISNNKEEVEVEEVKDLVNTLCKMEIANLETNANLVMIIQEEDLNNKGEISALTKHREDVNSNLIGVNVI